MKPPRHAAGIGRLVLSIGIGLTAAASAADGPPGVQGQVQVLAAGSLRAPLSQLGQAFERQTGVRVDLVFGASGLLKDRIAGGERADVFASANTAHPQALAGAGWAAEVQVFARNALCVLAAPGFNLRGKTLAQRLLDSDVVLGSSTPKADPSGDYAFEMFERIEASAAAGPGAAAALKARARQLTGGPNSPPPPVGRNVYADLVAAGQADAFVTYCTNAAQARREQPQLQVLDVPAAYNVVADYGLAVRRDAPREARAFADFVLGAAGRAILVEHGFTTP